MRPSALEFGVEPRDFWISDQADIAVDAPPERQRARRARQLDDPLDALAVPVEQERRAAALRCQPFSKLRRGGLVWADGRFDHRQRTYSCAQRTVWACWSFGLSWLLRPVTPLKNG